MGFEEKSYLEDPYCVKFSSRVRWVEPAGEGLCAVFLERTYFYPVSGGQPDDRGTISGARVVSVEEEEKGVKHLVAGSFKEGETVECEVEWKRRFDHMQQHSGQHLLSRVFLELKGLETVSFHLGDETCTIDLSGRFPGKDDIAEVESRANDFVFANLPIRHRIISPDELEKIESAVGEGKSTSHYRPKIRCRAPEGVEQVRMVEIEGLDLSACCGTHVRATGEIGIVKILGVERTRGLSRVEFVCGKRALSDYSAKHGVLAEVAGSLTTDWREVPRVIAKLSEQSSELRKKKEELELELAAFRAVELGKPTGSAGSFSIVKRVVPESESSSLRDAMTRIRNNERTIVLFGISGQKPALLFGCTPGIPLNMGEILKRTAEIMGAKGGGGKDFAQGGGGDGSRISEALEEAERLVRNALEEKGLL